MRKKWLVNKTVPDSAGVIFNLYEVITTTRVYLLFLYEGRYERLKVAAKMDLISEIYNNRTI